MTPCAWLAIATILLGCSGSGGSGSSSCGKVAACGGNVVGTWKVTDSCTSGSTMAMPMTGCPGETVKVTSTRSSGTLTFSADLTYTESLTASVSETATVPLSCLSAGGVTGSCDQLATFFNGGVFGDAGTSSATCTTSGSSCNCDISLSLSPASATGTYVVSGSSLTTTSGGSVGGGSYCVQGSSLHLISTPDGGAASGTSGGDIVATRQ